MRKSAITALLLSVIVMFTFCVPTFAQKPVMLDDNALVQTYVKSQSLGADQLQADDRVQSRSLVKLLLKLVKEGAEYLIKINKKGNVIKKADFKIKTEHIFSKDHKKKGIMKLGKNEQAILNKFKKMIETADSAGVLKNNTNNQIRTVINGYKVEVRAYVKDGELKNLNAFVVDGDWPKTNYGNIVYLAPRFDD